MKLTKKIALVSGVLGFLGAGECIAFNDTVEREFDFSGKKSLKIDMEDSNISYVGEARETLSIIVERTLKGLEEGESMRELENAVLTFEETNDGLLVVGKQRFNRRELTFQQKTIIRGPTGIELSILLEDGDVTIRAVEGAVSLNVEDGDVEGEGLSGPVAIELEDGNLELSDLSGALDLALKDGNIDLSFSDTPSGASHIRLKDGNIAIHFSETVAADLSLQIKDGKLEMGEVGEAVVVKSDKKRQIFALNGGGVSIDVEVKDGNISVN